MKEILIGLQIFLKYDPDGCVCAEHDIIYAYPKIKRDTLSEDEIKTITDVGWFWDDGNDCWAHFT